MSHNYPAIALIEYASIASGIKAGDAMVKRAPITVLKSGTVHNGKYLIFIGGSVASVHESYIEGLRDIEGEVIDSIFLPDIHTQVHEALFGKKIDCPSDAIGIIETSTVSATIRSADASVKGANVKIIEMRTADDIGGKAFAIFAGSLENVEAAVELSRNSVSNPAFLVQESIIPNLHEEIAIQIDQSTRFVSNSLVQLEGGEI
jgi:microcompartment protein CcmL/EutN